MAARPVKVAFLADTADLRSSLKKAEGAMESAAAEAKSAGQKIDTAFDGAAESADRVASKGAQAAGALSGLGDLIGGKFGAAMQVGGVGMQAFADAGDLVNVITESNIVKKIKDIAVSGAQRVATTAMTVATYAQATAQKVMNAAMRANPIGLVITAITLLVAGLVLAYKKSETFRKIVDKAWGGIKTATRAVFDWVRDKIKGAFEVVTKVFMNFTGPGLLIKHWDTIKKKTGALIDWFGGLGGKIAAKTRGMWDGIKNAFRDVINAVINWWNGLSFSLPSITVGGKKFGGQTISTPNLPNVRAAVPVSGRYGAGGTVIAVTVNVPPTANPVETGRELQRVLDAYAAAGGRRRAA